MGEMMREPRTFSEWYLNRFDVLNLEEAYPRVPRHIRLITFLLHHKAVDLAGWMEHTGDWDFEWQITTTSRELVFFGNPEVSLVYKGMLIGDLNEWAWHHLHKKGEDYSDRLFELRVIGEYDDDSSPDGQGQSTHHFNLIHLRKILITF